MTTDQSAWLAGFIDGEGCINLYPANQGRLTVGFSVRVSIANTHLPTLEHIQEMLGFGTIVKVRKDTTVDKPGYALWFENAPDIIRLLEEISPWLVTKAEQASILLDFAYTVGHGPLSSETRDFRQDMYRRMKILNKKGPKEAQHV